MTGTGNSASRQAAAIRSHARRGVWRRVLAWAGVTVHTRRADARAGLWERGAAGEEATVRLLEGLRSSGWKVRHDLRLPGWRANLDHVLVAPSGDVVVLDTKVWRRNWPTALVGGRVHCGLEDRHEQVAKVAGYAARIQAALGLPGVTVLPLLVVHGSPVAGGFLAAPVAGVRQPVLVLSPPFLVPTLLSARQVPDRARAAAVVDRVDRVLKPYGEGG